MNGKKLEISDNCHALIKIASQLSEELKKVSSECEKVSSEVEQLHVQLAGCGVAALGGTTEPAKPGAYGWTIPYQDVLDLRLKYEKLLVEISQLTTDRNLAYIRGAEAMREAVTERVIAEAINAINGYSGRYFGDIVRGTPIPEDNQDAHKKV